MRSRFLYSFILLFSAIALMFAYNKYYKKGTPAHVVEKNHEEVIIKDLRVGSGPIVAQSGVKVKINYKAALEDGFVFDNSLERNEPLTFKIGSKRIIKGLNEGVIGMKVGGQRTVVVPPKFGFGKNTLGGIIPQDSFIFLEIELLDAEIEN